MNLPSELRKQINRSAHAAGVQHGELTRRRLLAECTAMLAAGKSRAEIAAFLAGRAAPA